MLSYKRVAQVLRACGFFISRELVNGHTLPKPEKLDALADAIMSIEYYLEAFVQSRVHPASVLDVAERGVAELGYPVDNLPEQFAAELQEEDEADLIELVAAEPTPAHTPAPVTLDVPTKHYVNPEVDDEILEIFIEESQEEVAKINTLLATWIALRLGRPMTRAANRRQASEDDFRFGLARARTWEGISRCRELS